MEESEGKLMEIIITTVAAVASGIVAGWKLREHAQRADLNRRYRRSVHIAARGYKRRQNNGRPRKVHTAGDDYAV
ncbi:hypothetical protein [Butyricicoccus sp.]|uniref:hypothetical protein n=1 Tax=Butyricicoccus sp. TaxID=2049021 RepID=UPI003F149EE0